MTEDFQLDYDRIRRQVMSNQEAAAVVETIEQLRTALRAISEQYENQNISHVDFRVGAKRIADAALAKAHPQAD